MRSLVPAVFFAAFTWLASAGFSFAQAPVNWPALCGPAEAILGVIQGRYGEAPTGQGTFDGRLFQIWENRDTGTWTFILVMPGGGVCALASGVDWQPLVPHGESL